MKSSSKTGFTLNRNGFRVSRYLARAPSEEVVTIFREFATFWDRTDHGNATPVNFDGSRRLAGLPRA